jgi:hypothetical protein
LSRLTLKAELSVECRETSFKIFDAVEDKPWIQGIMSILFCLDMMLQNNPMSKTDTKTNEEITNLINELEEKMRKV